MGGKLRTTTKHALHEMKLASQAEYNTVDIDKARRKFCRKEIKIFLQPLNPLVYARQADQGVWNSRHILCNEQP